MAILIQPNGDIQRKVRIHCLKDLQKAVGGLIEEVGTVTFGNFDDDTKYTVLANEEGTINGMEMNEFAFYRFGLTVCGPILLVSGREYK